VEPIELSPAIDYQILTPVFPPEDKIRGHPLGYIEELKYVDHDLMDAMKFPWFRTKEYQRSELDGEILLPVEWAVPIQHSTIINALRMPHFRHSTKINVVVKLLLSRVNGGFF